MDEEREQSIREYVERVYVGIDSVRAISKQWLSAYDTRKRCDVLFYWNGEDLWGPYVCDEQRPTSYKA